MLIFSVVLLCVVVLLGTHALWVRTARRTRADSALRDLEAAVGQTEAAVDRIERDVDRMTEALHARLGRAGVSEAGPPENVRLVAWGGRERERIVEWLRSVAALDWRPEPSQCYLYYAYGGSEKSRFYVFWTPARQRGKWTFVLDELGGLCGGVPSPRDLLEPWESREWDAAMWAHLRKKRPAHRSSGESLRRGVPVLPAKWSATPL